jgi:hypothetical protein
VEFPTEIEAKDCIHCTRKYHYRAHNFTVCVFWAPFLVRWNLTRAGALQFMDPHNVFLDEADPEWSRGVAGYDYVVLNGAKWFTRPTILYEGGRLVGCNNDCHGGDPNATAATAPPEYAVRASFRTALRALREHPVFRGTVIVRTVAPPHYENGKWYDGGNCLRTRPMRSDETGLPETEAAFHAAQVGGGGGGWEVLADGRQRDDADARRRAPWAVRPLAAREGRLRHRLRPLVLAWPRRRLERAAAPLAPWLGN